MNPPLANGPERSKSRDGSGRFTHGNTAAVGRGNPHAAYVAKLRAALFGAVKPTDVEAVARALVEKAKTGDVAATRELLERLLGSPVQADLLERLENLERLAGQKGGQP